MNLDEKAQRGSLRRATHFPPDHEAITMSPIDNLAGHDNRRRRRGIKEQFQSLTYLLKHSVTVVGDNKEIMYPWVAMVIYNFVVATLTYAGISFLFFGHILTILMGMAMIAAAVLLWVYEFFFFAYQKTRLSWLVYEMLCGRERSFSDARERTSTLKSQVRKLAVLDMIKRWVKSQKSSRGGIMGFLINLALAGLGAVLDLAKHYMLPAVAIDGLHVKETAEQMKSLKDRVPETLVGVFGIDILGNVVIKIVGPIYLAIGFFGVVMALLLGGFLPSFMVFEFTGDGGESFAIAWPPLVAMLFLVKSISILLANVVACLKVSYFTTFYTELTHRDRLSPKLQAELEGFLRLEDDAQLDEAITAS